MVQAIVAKPFEKEAELVQMKSELSKLEREIAIKIQENQMKQAGILQAESVAEPIEEQKPVQRETPVIPMIARPVTPLQVAMAKLNVTSINGKTVQLQPVPVPEQHLAQRKGYRL